MAIVDASAQRLLSIARLGDVEWVEPWWEPELAMDQSSRILGARQGEDGQLAGDGSSVWSYDAENDTFEGLTGRGVIVNIADTGIDETHPAFEGRIVFKSEPPGFNATNDTAGHGTHVAGIVAGNGSWRDQDTNRTDGQYAGVAPGAGLVAQLVFTLFKTTTQLSQDAVAGGAFVNSNSWGAAVGGSYTSTAQAYDELVLDANGRDPGSPQMAYVFASGNAGPGRQTVDSPGSAKNVITVGSVGGTNSSSNTVSGFSSRGPAADGRLKPDVVAPGAGITSARTFNSGCSGGYLGCSYKSLGGTSMSTPAVAGAAALFTQWYQEGNGRLPSAAMVKASLIAGATPLPGYTWPDYAQGWGRVNISRTVNEGPTFRHLDWDEDTALTLSGRTNVTYRVFAGSDEELRVVLVWSDVAGTTSSSKALINDLDLEVRAPDGTVLPGNLFQGGYSVPGTTRDAGNNTEVVRVRAPQRGIWEITVSGATLPSGDQRFALVAQGNVTGDWISVEPGPAEFLPASPRENDPFTVVVPVVNTGTRRAGPMDVEATLSGPEGNVSQTIHLLGIMAGDDRPAVFHFAPQRGTHTLEVAVDPGGTSGDLLPADNTRQDTVFVRGYEVEIDVLSAPSDLGPLGSTPFVMRVVNKGNVVDQVSVAAAGPVGWTIAMNYSTSFLDPGDAALVSGAITAPERVLAGVVVRFDFSASSVGNSSRETSVELAVEVEAFVALHLKADAFSPWVDPGGVTTFTFFAENAGNVEVSLDLVASLDAGAGDGWGLVPLPDSLTIPPYSNTTGRVEVTAPAGAAAAEVRTIVVQPVSPQIPAISPLAFQVFVARTRGFDVQVDPWQASVSPGGEATFAGTIQNRGNGREYFTVVLTPAAGGVDGVYWSASPGGITIDPGEASSFAVTARVLPRSLAGDATVRVHVMTDGSQTEEIDLAVTVLARRSLTVTAPPRVVMPQGSAYSAGVSVTNDGNIVEVVSMESSGGEGAGVHLEGFSGTVTLAPGDTHRIKARLVADPASPPGTTEFRLVARGSGAGVSGEVVIGVEVRPAGVTTESFLPGSGILAAVGAVAAALIVRRRAPRG
jgi:subtilisin family serine protease